MPEFKIHVEIFLCPPWMHGKIAFPIGLLGVIDGQPVIDSGHPDLVFFECICRVTKVREEIKSVWGDTISDEYVLRYASEKSDEIVQITNYHPEFIEGSMENFLLRQAARMLSDYYPSKVVKQIKTDLFMEAFKWSMASADDQ